LQDAYQLAVQEYNKDKGNIYIKSSYSWVLYDLLKSCVIENDLDNFIKYIDEFLLLEIEPG
jgi:hypothetical protein